MSDKKRKEAIMITFTVILSTAIAIAIQQR